MCEMSRLRFVAQNAERRAIDRRSPPLSIDVGRPRVRAACTRYEGQWRQQSSLGALVQQARSRRYSRAVRFDDFR